MAAQWIQMPPGVWHVVTTSTTRSAPDGRLEVRCACGRKGPTAAAPQTNPIAGQPVCQACQAQGGS
jgi:hypothetical protein